MGLLLSKRPMSLRLLHELVLPVALCRRHSSHRYGCLSLLARMYRLGDSESLKVGSPVHGLWLLDKRRSGARWKKCSIMMKVVESGDSVTGLELREFRVEAPLLETLRSKSL